MILYYDDKWQYYSHYSELLQFVKDLLCLAELTWIK